MPDHKIVERYHRCLDLLDDAVQLSDRAYIFDSSDNRGPNWIAEITNGSDLVIRSDSLPAWFRRSLGDKFEAAS